MVETIDFHDDEDAELPPSMNIKDVMALNKARPFEQEDAEQGAGANADVEEVEMDVEMDDEERALITEAAQENETGATTEIVETVEDEDAPRKIVKDYKRVVSRYLAWMSCANELCSS